MKNQFFRRNFFLVIILLLVVPFGWTSQSLAGVISPSAMPASLADSYATNEDVPLDVPAPGILTNDSDVDGHVLSAILNHYIGSGVLTLNLDGSFLYTPSPNFNGVDEFTYVATDVTFTSAVTTVSITVAAENDPPTAQDLQVGTLEDTPLEILLSGSDPDGDSLTYEYTSPTNGSLSGTAPNLIYLPNPNYFGSDGFTYTVADQLVISPPAVVSIQISPVNDPPTAISQSIITNEDQPVQITLTASDPDDTQFTYSISDAPNHGVLSGEAPLLTYTPNPNYFGTDSFSYQVNDGTGTSVPAPIEITIASIPDAPSDIQLVGNSILENRSIGTIVGTLSATDVDSTSHTFLLVDGTGSSGNSSFAIQGNQLKTAAAFNFEQASSYSIRVEAQDPDGQATQKVFAISVTNVNEPPQSIQLNDNSIKEMQPIDTLVGNLVTDDPDADETITFSLVDGSGSTDNHLFAIQGDKLVAKETFDYETKNKYNVRIRAVDHGGLNVEQALIILIENVNEVPEALDNPYIAYTGETLQIAAPGILGNDSDPDGDTLQALLVTEPGHSASFSLNPNGSFTYKAEAGFTGLDFFEYQAYDGQDKSKVTRVEVEVVDATSPRIAWLSPVVDGEVFYMDRSELSLTLQAQAIDDVRVQYVQFYRWDADKEEFIYYQPVTTSPYTIEVSLDDLNDGWNQIFVRAYDENMNVSGRTWIWVRLPYYVRLPLILQ